MIGMKLLIPIAIVGLLVNASLHAEAQKDDRSDQVDRLKRASEVFAEIMKAPDRGIPSDLLGRAECVAIVPGLIRGGFVVGGRYGKGIVMCRKGDRSWTAPLFLRIEGGSFGLLIGGQRIDLVMLVMNRRGMEKLIGDRFTIGVDASAAAGPVGRRVSGETDIRLTAEIFTYSRSRGLFAGVSLEGAVVRPDKDDNRAFYRRDVDARAILLEGTEPMPPEAKALSAALSRQSR
jgi:lipid-binding SYLF domain-containing protein